MSKSMKNICRLCLIENPTNFSLFKNDLNKMLETLTLIKIEPDDQIVKVCLKCSLNLKLAYRIQQSIIKADEKLRKDYLNNLAIKEEVYVIKTEEITIHDDQNINLNSVQLCKSTCVICDTTMPEDTMKTHIQQHFNDVQTCNLCKQNFSNAQSYREHLTNHPKRESYKCDKCNTSFQYKTFYDLHLNKAHSSKTKTPKRKITSQKADPNESYTCDTCSKKFPTRRQFRAHTHKRRTCTLCKKEVTIGNFSKHMNAHNSGPQICDMCGKTCSNAETLRSHILYNHKKKQYECKECNVIFPNRQTYLRHKKRKHSGADHVCDICGRKFIFGYHLNKHIRLTHLKERPYICEFCNRGFSGMYALKTHKRQHTNETPFRCEVCGEGFRQRVSLKSHLKSKHDIAEEITCHCKICGKGFASMHAIETHMRSH